jgi:DNA (cytosine-5)-methyltransferase 1
MLTYASTFAGVEGFGLGFGKAGMTPTFMCEKHEPRMRILETHFPDVPKGGDIKDVHGSDLGRPDVVAGGFPCKDLSIGKASRLGLAGARSGLYWQFQRCVEEHLRLVDAVGARWAVLENVPGLLTSNSGRDMAAVLLGLQELGYGWAYRVVDSQGVGSAQRRPRVIIVGHRGGDPRPAWAVLADTDGGPGDPRVRPEPTRDVLVGAGGRTDIRVYRKSSRPQRTAELGGWASYKDDGFLNTLTNNDSGSNARQTHIVVQDNRARALTPIEWERAQGFPDNWTFGIPDIERYHAMGDAMNVHTATWLGQRIVAADAALPMIRPDRRETAA